MLPWRTQYSAIAVVNIHPKDCTVEAATSEGPKWKVMGTASGAAMNTLTT